MNWFVLCCFLHLRFLCDAQIPAPSIRPTGCAGPPVLCCAGTNSSCFRGCYCDQFCMTFRDCCPDYRSTCTESVTQAPTRRPTTRSSNITYAFTNITAPSAFDVSTTSASTVPTSTPTSQTSSDTSTLAVNGTSSLVSNATAATTDTPAYGKTTLVPAVSDSPATSTTSSSTSVFDASTTSASTLPATSATSSTTSAPTHTSTPSLFMISSKIAPSSTASTPSPTTATGQKSSTTASPPLDGFITALSTGAEETSARYQPEHRLSEGSENLDNVISFPGDGTKAGIPNKNTFSTTGASSDKGFQTVTFHLKASLLSYNQHNKDVILEAISSFLSNILLQLNCERCILKVQHIKPS